MDALTTTTAEAVVDVVAEVEAAVILFGSSCFCAAVVAAVASDIATAVAVVAVGAAVEADAEI